VSYYWRRCAYSTLQTAESRPSADGKGGGVWKTTAAKNDALAGGDGVAAKRRRSKERNI